MEPRSQLEVETVEIFCADLPHTASLLDRSGAVFWTNGPAVARRRTPFASVSGDVDAPGNCGDGAVLMSHVDVPVHLPRHGRATLRLMQTHPSSLDDKGMLVLQETQHRARNLISLVMAIASQSFADRTMDPGTSKFIDRLASLDAVVRVGCEAEGEFCPVSMIVGQIARRFQDPGRPQFQIEGDIVALPARWAHTLTLVLHELATNAIRHGALRDPKGKVDVTWRRSADVEGHVTFDFEWREHVTTPVVPTSRKGFGSRMLRTSIETSRQCTGSLALLPSGLVYKWTLRLSAGDLPIREG